MQTTAKLKASIRLICFGFAVLICMLSVSSAYAQNAELTRQDDHALLYASQAGFSETGTPMVQMRIAEGLDSLKIRPKGDFIVIMSGTGGGAIRLKGNQVYEISIHDGHAGTYRYGVILSRGDQPDKLTQTEAICQKDKIETERISVGAVFALKGHVFDNRENLLVTQRRPELQYSKQLITSGLPLDPLLDAHEIYSDLLRYPTGQIILQSADGDIRIENQNILWLSLPEAGATLYDIEDEFGKKTDLKLNARLILTPDKDGKLTVVQSADIETILRGIVPAEIFKTSPIEALKAQAIAARTTLIAQLGARHQSDPYHLCNHQHCQVYRGLSGADPRTDEAIEATRGLVMFHDQKLVQSYYSAHCGGISAGSLETWGLPNRPYLVSKTDDDQNAHLTFASDAELLKWLRRPAENYCASAPAGKKAYQSTKYARWEVEISRDDLNGYLKKAGQNIGEIEDIEFERGESNRVIRMTLKGTRGKYEVFRELGVRRFLGGLKSGLFVADITKQGRKVSQIKLYGAGFGHGVGMCQTGAIGMAQRNQDVEAILKHYFPGTHLEKLW
ncbi:MAG: SpoIID/LytB domain-containing protein [Proteobacteria bacterium]|nr:SpoIID/LytB domain-containing protein [Pseudomonadota bacterium]